MGKIRAFVLVVLLSIKWIFKTNLGDLVCYKANKHIVCNGVRYNQWRLGTLNNGDNGWVSRAECKKVLTIKNLMGSFKSGYRFYMTNWYDVWVRAGIEAWMKGCKIW